MFNREFENFKKRENIKDLPFNRQVQLFDNFMFSVSNVVSNSNSSSAAGGQPFKIEIDYEKSGENVIVVYNDSDDMLKYYIIDYTNEVIHDTITLSEYTTQINIYPLHKKGYAILLNTTIAYFIDFIGNIIHTQNNIVNIYANYNFIPFNYNEDDIYYLGIYDGNSVRSFTFNGEYDFADYYRNSSKYGVYILDYTNVDITLWYINFNDDSDKELVLTTDNENSMFVIQSEICNLAFVLNINVNGAFMYFSVYDKTIEILQEDISDFETTYLSDLQIMNELGSLVFLLRNEGNYIQFYYNCTTNAIYYKTLPLYNVINNNVYTDITQQRNYINKNYTLILYNNSNSNVQNFMLVSDEIYIINIFEGDVGIRDEYLFCIADDALSKSLSLFSLARENYISYVITTTDEYYNILLFDKNSDEVSIITTELNVLYNAIDYREELNNRIILPIVHTGDGTIYTLYTFTYNELIPSNIWSNSYDYYYKNGNMIVYNNDNTTTYYSTNTTNFTELELAYQTHGFDQYSLTDDYLSSKNMYILDNDTGYIRILHDGIISDPFIGYTEGYYDFSKKEQYITQNRLILIENTSIYGVTYFSDKSNGNYIIDDGLNDMYDSGNTINTNLENNIPYTHTQRTDNLGEVENLPPTPSDYPMDGVITSSNSSFGEGSSYVTNLYPGIFYLSVDSPNITQFSIDGELGADGSGIKRSYEFMVDSDGNVVTSNNSYVVFVKNVYNASDPSVNHIIIYKTTSNVDLFTHEIGSSTNDDLDRITEATEGGFSTVTSIDYLLVSKLHGTIVSHIDVENIVKQFITITKGLIFTNKLAAMNSNYSTITDAFMDDNIVDKTIYYAYDLDGNLIDRYIINHIVYNADNIIIDDRLYIYTTNDSIITFVNDKFQEIPSPIPPANRMYNDYLVWWND